ncbi:glycosyltransferase family 4 protein [Burkholderia ubonensis]|uniref:glycosyltransferase family 4 protein n=1 Tax=Burkholderia ubonensis TaxID=101571 RepID=UPI0009B3C201|nr:glycosyltransferase family 1 protein [Burkholderia ubonensis]
MAQVWIEISLLEHWGPKPHGIPRVTQNIFLQSLRRNDVRYFYYNREAQAFVAVREVQFFKDLAFGIESYSSARLPAGMPFENELCQDDRILFSEVGWDHAPYFDCMISLKKAHPDTVFEYLVHDLIALKFPQFFTQEFGDSVRLFLRRLPLVCDRYICVSKSTARDVREILDSSADTAVMMSGSDVSNAPYVENKHVSPYVLNVATIEIRKNHILLYHVWRKLVQRLGGRCPKLLLVGRTGWLAGDVAYLMKHDPVVKDFVEIRHDVTNDQLVGLFKNSMFTVFPSLYEGWGLPASESFFYGKVCATSNTSSLPEINPFPELMFDPYNHQEAFNVINGLISDPNRLNKYEQEIPRVFRRQTWEQSFRDLYEIVSR